MILNPEQQKRLAELAQALPDEGMEWRIITDHRHGDGVYAGYIGSYYTPTKFEPSLTGTPEQKAQALDVILAFHKLLECGAVSSVDYAKSHTLVWLYSPDPSKDGRRVKYTQDPLTAASLAILENDNRKDHLRKGLIIKDYFDDEDEGHGPEDMEAQ